MPWFNLTITVPTLPSVEYLEELTKRLSNQATDRTIQVTISVMRDAPVALPVHADSPELF